MIDPAIIDLMHHMSKAPQAVERRAEARSLVQDAEARECYVREIETQVGAWIGETEARVSALAERIKADPAKGESLHRLDQMIETFEAAIPREAAFFSKAEKQTLIAVKRAKVASAAAGQKLTAQRERILGAFAAYGLAKQEAVFAMRALRAELTGAGRRGPVFDDASALGAFLRGAVA